MSDLIPLQESSEWRALEEHQRGISKKTIMALFEEEPDRFDRFSLEAAGVFLDYSKNLHNQTTIDLLLSLAEKADVSKQILAMFVGEELNNTEQRPALHVALRSPRLNSDQEKLVQQTLKQMESFSTSVQNGEWLGYDKQAITDVVNIGIGGSDLGPAMVYEALKPFQKERIRCHFVSNVDPCHLQQTLSELQPATTLFVIASKTFTTIETIKNAEAAKKWILNSAKDEAALPRHFVAVSANIEKAKAFGIEQSNIFPMWDWVGGRYSLWSAIGLPLALGLGMDNFKALLRGAHAMDEHFRTASLRQNIPLIMALLNIWYLNFFQAESRVVLPYCQNLHLFPAFLQQLDMESLGKSVRKDGSSIKTTTGGIVWGSAGTNGQHSFHQLLHQGSHLIPADFIAIAQSPCKGEDHLEQQQILLANCFAQSQALMQGKSLEEALVELKAEGLNDEEAGNLARHKVIAGNKPSSTIVLKKLTPETLGSLIACYEHKVFSQSIILQINAFDQWGVQLGKVMSTDLYKFIADKNSLESGKNSLEPVKNSLELDIDSSLDCSTRGLISLVK